MAEIDWGAGLLEWVWRMEVGRAALVTLATFWHGESWVVGFWFVICNSALWGTGVACAGRVGEWGVNANVNVLLY